MNLGVGAKGFIEDISRATKGVPMIWVVLNS